MYTQQEAYGPSNGVIFVNGKVVANRNPNAFDLNYPIGTPWINTLDIKEMKHLTLIWDVLFLMTSCASARSAIKTGLSGAGRKSFSS